MFTFWPTTSAGKLCLEMTHNALVQVFLSADFTTREQSAERISAANVSAKPIKRASPSAAAGHFGSHEKTLECFGTG